jgi:hypothetical protein
MGMVVRDHAGIAGINKLFNGQVFNNFICQLPPQANEAVR